MSSTKHISALQLMPLISTNDKKQANFYFILNNMSKLFSDKFIPCRSQKWNLLLTMFIICSLGQAILKWITINKLKHLNNCPAISWISLMARLPFLPDFLNHFLGHSIHLKAVVSIPQKPGFQGDTVDSHIT